MRRAETTAFYHRLGSIPDTRESTNPNVAYSGLTPSIDRRRSTGITYKLTSLIPVWSQTDPVPLAGGGSFRVSAIERPVVFVNSRQAVTALLVPVRAHVKDECPSYIVIRPVIHETPAGR